MQKGDSKLLVRFFKEIGILDNIRSIVYMIEDLFDKKSLMKNILVKDIHKGSKCFVLGTGSSISDIDLSLLEKEYTFGGNFIYYHPDFKKLQLNNYISTPSSSLLKDIHSKLTYYNKPEIFSEEDIHKWLNPNLRLCRYSIDPLTFFNNVDRALIKGAKVFLGSGCKKFITSNNIFQTKEVYYLKPGQPLLLADKQVSDISKRITLFDNAVFAMIAIAIYMGFEEIYLLGNDYTFEPAREFHFYDSLYFSKINSKELVINWMERIAAARRVELFKIEEDEDFFKPIFVQKGKDRSAQIILKEYLESLGIKVYNIVPEHFESPLFEKIAWQDVFQKIEYRAQ